MKRYDSKNKGNTNHNNIFLIKKTKRDTKSEKAGDYSHNDFQKNENGYFFKMKRLIKLVQTINVLIIYGKMKKK